MYIQLTTRCNMRCAHCCFACTEVGEDMTMETFKKACTVKDVADGNITIGGGEPTLHPEFKPMLEYIMETVGKVGIVTNGSNTEIALWLLQLTKEGKISATLSRDQWHDPIDESVVKAFEDLDEIRTVTNIRASGRGVNIEGANDHCCCDTVFVVPNGDIYACACFTQKIGTVDSYELPIIEQAAPEGYFIAGYCSNHGIRTSISPEVIRRELEYNEMKTNEHLIGTFICAFGAGVWTKAKTLGKIQECRDEYSISDSKFAELLKRLSRYQEQLDILYGVA